MAHEPVLRSHDAPAPFSRVGAAAGRELERRSASILGIGTSVPPFMHEQSTYPDYYFDETNCNHKTDLKAKFKFLCDKLQIHKRHLVVRRELLNQYPSLASHMDSSLSDRHKIVMEWVPKLAIQAAEAAIQDWGVSSPAPQAIITHMVMVTTSAVNVPGVDVLVAKALNLSPKVKRVMLAPTGCWGGAAALRVAKDVAENNYGARVLVVCSECSALFFRAPHETDISDLFGQAVFADGSGACIVGVTSTDRQTSVERPLFEIRWAGTTLVPGTEGAINGHFVEAGLAFHHGGQLAQPLTTSLADLIAADAMAHVGSDHEASNVESWNNMFWAVHPGSADVLSHVEQRFELTSEKLMASREILRRFGNMQSAAVFFVLDRMRRGSVTMKAATTGEGHRHGFLVGTGPGLQVECLVLRAASLLDCNTLCSRL